MSAQSLQNAPKKLTVFNICEDEIPSSALIESVKEEAEVAVVWQEEDEIVTLGDNAVYNYAV